MLENVINRMSASSNPLVRLIADSTNSRFVGFTIHTSYSDMTVMTNDFWREACNGLPMNSYLLATAMDATQYASCPDIDKRIVLLRIVGRAEISTDRDTLRAILEHFQNNPDTRDPTLAAMEPLSKGMLQWSGIECKVLGTFFMGPDQRLRFGADMEDFFAARHMRVQRPTSDALNTIVNFVDPIRHDKAIADAAAMGMRREPTPFRIGKVRFTSSSHFGAAEPDVPVTIFPGDFLGRRTAVFGMTRTGKSNTTKTMVSAVGLSAFETDLAVGQLIFDINGEYSNANQQDQGSSIAEVFADNTVRYRALTTAGFRDVRANFYESLELGLSFIAANLRDTGGSMSDDLQTLLAHDLSEPDPANHSEHTRWERQVSMYRCILSKAGFAAPANYRITIPVGQDALAAIYENDPNIAAAQATPATNKAGKAAAVIAYFQLQSRGSGKYDVAPQQAVEFWTVVRGVEKTLGGPDELHGIRGTGNRKWLNSVEYALLSVLVGRSSKNDNPIRSSNAIRAAALQFHSPGGSADIGRDIYQLLSMGRIVILDLSVGPPSVRERMAETIAARIFRESSDRFVQGQVPPRVVLYVEEAHNLIGKSAELDETWPRIAKEGAKYGISLVYATQEPSSIHANILANTENLFVTHLNNDGEIRALSSYYDFVDFAESLKRCQDVGFARIKTLSSNFITPTQIDFFDVNRFRQEYARLKQAGCSWFSPLPPM
ncbi:DUF87 domain-containing protein [Bradyrhizobium sp. ISRA442]|uniref:ATP-binding protein n=1 Tax=Bradyrhizobium sp. ISRA442 TaxID=2866197 RepID=UPI00311AE5BA